MALEANISLQPRHSRTADLLRQDGKNNLRTWSQLLAYLYGDALAALDSFAVGRDGRSALVRQMIERTLKRERRSSPHPPPRVRG